MRPLFIAFLFLLTGIFPAIAQKLEPSPDPDTFANLNRKGVILKGYDPVAYFTEGRPVKGQSEFQSDYKGAIYQFASLDNKKRFDSNPEKYKVWFGGYCAWAVSNGYTASIDVEAWDIVDGHLVVQYSKGVLRKWKGDPEGNFKRGTKYWPFVSANKGRAIDKSEID